MPAERIGLDPSRCAPARAGRNAAVAHQARAIAAVVDAAAQLQRLRNRIALLDAALRRVRARESAS